MRWARYQAATGASATVPGTRNARQLAWRDIQKETGAECRYCRWMVSDRHSFCPWCGRDIADQDYGLREFVLTDPDGNRVRIGSPRP